MARLTVPPTLESKVTATDCGFPSSLNESVEEEKEANPAETTMETRVVAEPLTSVAVKTGVNVWPACDAVGVKENKLLTMPFALVVAKVAPSGKSEAESVMASPSVSRATTQNETASPALTLWFASALK